MKEENNNYDYVIIGGGSAGCVLANRLSANPNTTVCLLEAGPKDTSPFIHIPLAIFMLLRSKVLNWHFWTEPQAHCGGRPMFWPRGKTLGGSSSINAMCYVRGNPKDYDEWESLGNKGWSYQDVFPYFKKMENFEPGENEFHGAGGPMNVAKASYMNPLMNVFVNAGQEIGYQVNNDYNAEAQEGVGYFYVAQKNGKRCSNATGYLTPIEGRKNLTIITGIHVSNIMFSGKKSIGVRGLQKGKSREFLANKEVILSAGAIGSPQILMLSGVGPREEIEKHGISLVHELPGVGQNLQDHLDIHISCTEKTRESVSFKPSYLWRAIVGAYQYFAKHKGEFTSNYTQAVGFLKSSPELDRPDLQWHFAPSAYTNSALEITPMIKYNAYTLMVCHLHPKSRGKIRLQSADPLAKPLIDPNYLSEEEDMNALVIGVKKSREVLKANAFDPHRVKEIQPGEHVTTDEEIKDYIRKNAETIYHPVGTCKMGVDPMAVVDPATLKVYGVDNLRVIDASVMPRVISGNTNAPTTMIAERGADMILEKNSIVP